ncbi:MAG TPA: hypothetical protein VLH09_03930 [Bryobacteraceae bacterium]|nr:hypothetical protein [Bryobacteraceae bacterium]
MDLPRAIKELYAEKRRLEDAIASLEELLAAKGGRAAKETEQFRIKGRRGRKSMPPEERRRVSERMRKYWAQRRSNRTRGAGRGSA